MIGGHSGVTADATYDFVPDGSAVSETRNIVETSTCMECDGIEFHSRAGDDGAVTFTLDPVDDLEAGTYMVVADMADRGRIGRDNYKTPSVAKTTFQVDTPDEEPAVARDCGSCHQGLEGTGMVMHDSRHNAARIRTERHVWQILRRREGLLEQDLNDLEQGTSFEEVARKRFSRLPKTGGAPWDLGYLKWNQVPEPWRNVVYDLKKDQMSGIIRGPNKRFWIIKLIDKREDPATTLESSKPMIVAVLKNAKFEELREKTERDLRTKATITYSKGPAGACRE